MKVYDAPHNFARVEEHDICPTLIARAGTGGGNVPLVLSVYENQRAEVRLSDKSNAITQPGGKPGQGNPVVLQEAYPINMANALRKSSDGAGGIGVGANEDPMFTLTTTSEKRAVCEVYRISSDASNCMRSGNPRSGINKADISPTLDTVDPSPSKSQGGLAIISQPPHCFKIRSGCEGGGKGYLGQDDKSFTLATNNDQYVMTTEKTMVMSEYGNAFSIGEEKAPPLKARPPEPYCMKKEPYMLAGNMIGRSDNAGPQGKGYRQESAFTLNATDVQGVAQARVRKLTPVECERLQGFPDNWTRIPYRGKSAEDCPDSPRYKAVGNSWAVPCVRWIGKRIQKALSKA